MAAVIVPEELEKQLTPAGSRALAMFVNEAIRDERGNILELVEERFARRVAESEKRLRVDMAESEKRLRVDMAESEKRLDGKITELRVELLVKMADLRADVIKWSFLFWITQMAAIAGLFLTR